MSNGETVFVSHSDHLHVGYVVVVVCVCVCMCVWGVCVCVCVCRNFKDNIALKST